MERTIKVTGKGKLMVKPDTIRLVFNLSDVRKTYEETLAESAKQTGIFKELFEKLGFEGSDLKTVFFNVNTEYESYQDEQKRWQQRFVGYKFVHDLKMEFDADNEMLGRVLYELANAAITPEFRIQYTVKDVESAKNELLAKAVADSRTKAEVLTKAAGVKLGEILNIDYSWSELELVAQPMGRMLKASAVENDAVEAYQMDITPEDIKVEDSVTVVWGIRG